MSISGKSLTSITADDLNNLVELEIGESRIIEYKEQLPKANDDASLKFLAQVSPFANASGGDILYGIRAEDGIPVDVPGLPGVNIDSQKLRLSQTLESNIKPRLLGVEMQPVPTQVGAPCLVIRVRRSLIGPHVVERSRPVCSPATSGLGSTVENRRDPSHGDISALPRLGSYFGGATLGLTPGPVEWLPPARSDDGGTVSLARRITALRFKQWIKDWDSLRFDPKEHRRRPSADIYLFAMPADELRALSGVFRRQRQAGEATGIQRGHDQSRSEQIRDYVQFGYPYSEMSPTRRASFDSDDLRKPGWLPTAIVVNILGPDDTRRGRSVSADDLISVSERDDNSVELGLPTYFSDSTWEPTALPPLEIIDGQHRLYAFDAEALPGDFELPVVAFHSLDIGWQAYLFWSINVSPKKINPSHAYDLYPLLRSQDWLEKFAESHVYREARAQELTEFLFRHPASPWHQRINMLGERGVRGVKQAGWVRALASSYLSSGRGRATKGLFGADLEHTGSPLPWTRAQQAAFLIFLWEQCRVAIRVSDSAWVTSLRGPSSSLPPDDGTASNDPAFSGPTTILNQEQGVRGLLTITNEIFYLLAEDLELEGWETDESGSAETQEQEITAALASLGEQRFSQEIQRLCVELMKYDFRSADTPNLSADEKLRARAFRGSGGYAALRDELWKMLEATNVKLETSVIDATEEGN